VTWDADKDKLKTAKNSQTRIPYLIVSKNYTKEVFHSKKFSLKNLALWSAAKEGDIAMFRRLIIKGADINCQTQGYGRTPLMYAVKNGQFLIVKFIVDKSGDVCKLDTCNFFTVKNK
jgi:ankyrin repeat protein